MKNDFLYSFIQAMDEGEMKYCRKFLRLNSEHSERGYITMSEVLRSMKKFDPVRLEQAVYGLPVAKHLAVEKTRLYGILLSHLSVLRESRKPINDPHYRLREATILFEMGLFEPATEAAEKGLEVAIWQEDLAVELNLRDLLRRVYKQMAQKNLIVKRTENEYALVMAGKKLAKLMRYHQINDRMYDYLRSYRVSDSEAVQRGIAELMAQPELTDGNMADSLPSQIRYYAIQQMYHSQRNDLKQSVEATKRLVALWEQRPDRIKNFPLEYMSSVSNLVGKLSISGHMDEALFYLQKLQSISVRGRRNQVTHFEYAELQFQLFHLNRGSVKEVLVREEMVMNGLRRFSKNIGNGSHLAMLYNFGIAHMLLNQRGKAIKQFDRIRQLGTLSERQDLQGVGRLLRLLLMSERGSEFSFEHYLRNSKRFFKETERGYDLEETVYGWLQEHSRLVDQQKIKQSLESFAELLQPLMEKKMLGAEEMWIWATAKASDKMPLEVFKRLLA